MSILNYFSVSSCSRSLPNLHGALSLSISSSAIIIIANCEVRNTLEKERSVVTVVISVGHCVCIIHMCAYVLN